MIKIVIFLAICTFLSQSCLVNQYYNSNDAQCSACPSRCLQCSNATYCYNCSSNYYFNNYQCLPCTHPCRTCMSSSLCLACNTNFYFNSNSHSCILCEMYCATCSNQTYCQVCQWGYTMNAGNCYECQSGCTCNGMSQSCDQSANRNIKILAAVIIPFSLLLVIIAMIFCWRRKQHRNIIPRSNNQSTQNVEISQISFEDNTQQKVKWNNEENKNAISAQEICSICLDFKVDTEMVCGHVYHLKCIGMWVQKQRCCPLCKNKSVDRVKKYCGQCSQFQLQQRLKNLKQSKSELLSVCKNCVQKKNNSNMESMIDIY